MEEKFVILGLDPDCDGYLAKSSDITGHRWKGIHRCTKFNSLQDAVDVVEKLTNSGPVRIDKIYT